MDLIQREPPTVPERSTGPNTELDRLILRALESREPMWWTAREIIRATGAQPKDVWRRLGILTRRGVLRRARPWDGPLRGPGSHIYTMTSTGSAAAGES